MPSQRELHHCAISSWYPQFEGVTFKSIILPVPEGFGAWLLSDGISIPEGSNAFPTRTAVDPLTSEGDYFEWSSDDDDDASGAPEVPGLLELRAAMDAAIEELGGAVLPKLTWSCPKDAAWMMTGNSLRCQNADEVLLLLKSSDRVAHDVSGAMQSCHDAGVDDAALAAREQPDGGAAASALADEVRHVVTLRKWYDLKPGREFRCFVDDGALIGVSQRDVTQRFDGLAAEAAAIQSRIEAFHTRHIQNRFPLRRYSYDCYVPSSPTASVRLMDFNPAGGTTAPLLFELHELWPADAAGAAAGAPAGGEAEEDAGTSDAAAPEVDFRIITEPVVLRPAAAAYGVPFDFVDSSEGSALNTLLEQARQAGDLWENLQQQGGGGGAGANGS